MTTNPPDEASFLIIDDEESMREACSQVLLREGYSVRTAKDGEEGLEMAGQEAPDVVILDLKMPKVPGLATLDELNEIAPDSVKIVITAYATVSSALEAVRAGAYDFLPKPFTPEELRVIAARALERRGLILKSRRLQEERDQCVRRLDDLFNSEIRGPVEDALAKLHLVEGQMSGNPEQLELLRGAQTILKSLLKRMEAPGGKA